MLRSKTIDKLCGELSLYYASPGELVDGFIRHPTFDAERKLPIETYLRGTTQVWLLSALQYINEQTTIPVQHVAFDEENGNRSFRRDCAERVWHYKKGKQGKPRGSYDAIVRADDHIAVIDIRLRNDKTNESRPDITRNGGQLRSFFKPATYEQKLTAVSKFLHLDVAYIFVLAQDVHENLERQAPPLYAQFKSAGAHPIPFSYVKADFERDIRNEVTNRGLRILQS